MKRFLFAAMFFSAAVLMPILIWVALAVAVRKLLLQSIRRTRLIRSEWGININKPSGPSVITIPIFMLFIGVLMPLLIWVAFASITREMLLRWRQRRLPSARVCGADSDCPPGYICISGKCIPQY